MLESRTLSIVLLLALGVCASAAAGERGRQAGSPPPSVLLGEFVDDHGIRYSISPARWLQGEETSFEIVEWHVEEQYLLAHNDATNSSSPGLWTRVDWLRLDDEAGEYAWAFCYSVFDAPTAAAAIAAPPADRNTPRTGCNGFPFSRMRRTDPEAASGAAGS